MYIKKHMDLRLRLPALVAWGQALKEAPSVGSRQLQRKVSHMDEISDVKLGEPMMQR